MASQAKVTLLIETKFEKFQALKTAGKELQEALGVGKIAKEYESLNKSLGSILTKIKAINTASGKSGLLGGGGVGPITGSHGARGTGGAGVGGGAVYGPQQSAWQQYSPGKATEAGFGQMHTVTSTMKGQIRDQIMESEGRKLNKAQMAQRHAGLQSDFQLSAWQRYAPGKAMGAGFGQMHTTSATVKGIWNDKMAPPGLKGAAYNAAQASMMSLFGNEVYPGYQDRRYGIGEGNTASPLRDPYMRRTSDSLSSYAGLPAATAGVAGANVLKIKSEREQAAIKARMSAQGAETVRLGDMEAAHMKEFFGPSGPPAVRKAASAAAAQARLQGQVAGVRDAGARANPLIGGALARGLRASSPEARAAVLRGRNMRRAGMVGGAAAIFGGAVGAAGSLATGTLGGMGGAGSTMGAFGTLGGGMLGATLGAFGGLPGAFAGAVGGSMVGSALGSTFGTIGGKVAQYGEKGLALQEMASGLAAMGAGAMGGQITLGVGGEATQPAPQVPSLQMPTDTQRRGGPGGIITTALGAKTKWRTIKGQAEQRLDPGSGRPEQVIPATSDKRVRVRDTSSGWSTKYGYSVDQIMGMMGQAYGTAMAAPSDLRDRGTIQMLQRSVGVDPKTSGQMLFGLMRSKGGGFQDFAEGLETEGMSYGEQRGLFQTAGRMLGPEFARTGISGRKTVANIKSFTGGRGSGSGFRATQYAEGAVNYGRNIAQGGPKSPYDYALISALAGGGGVSPTELLSIYKGLETGEILKPGTKMRGRFMGYLSSVRGSAGGDTGLATFTLNKALQPILPGLGLSSTDKALGMIEKGSTWDALQDEFGVSKVGGGLGGIAKTNVSKQQKKAAKIRNEVLSLGTDMIDTMQVFKEAAEAMAKALKGAAPIMAEIHRTLAASVPVNMSVDTSSAADK